MFHLKKERKVIAVAEITMNNKKKKKKKKMLTS